MDSTLVAVRRDTKGKNEAVRTRQSGKIPAVLYGGDSKTGESVSVDPKELGRILHSQSGLNSIISLKIDGAPETRVLVKQYQIGTDQEATRLDILYGWATIRPEMAVRVQSGA